jgi:hypothetical protein
MRILELVVYEHPSVPAGESRLFHRTDDPALPEGLWGRARSPCLVTGDLSRLGETLTLLRLAELWGAASPGRRGKGARV